MNLKNTNLEEFKELIRNCDDKNFNHILWVTTEGDVYINKFTTANPTDKFEKETPNLLFWKGVFYHNNNYVGIEASEDTVYIENILKELTDNWEIKYSGHLTN